MVLRKQCKCCNKEITTKNAKLLGRNDMGLWLNCQYGTTIFLKQPSEAVTTIKSFLYNLNNTNYASIESYTLASEVREISQNMQLTQAQKSAFEAFEDFLAKNK